MSTHSKAQGTTAVRIIGVVVGVVIGAVILIIVLIGGILVYESIPGSRRPTTAAVAAAKAEAACPADLQCWGERHMAMAVVLCTEPIENLSQYAAEWTGSFLDPTFKRWRWHGKAAGTITYIGDRIQYQNGFGAWQPARYECDYDPANERVLAARATPGRVQ